MKTIFVVAMLIASNVGVAAILNLQAYQGASGEILVHRGGTDVDPYFALKALLIADAGGLDTREALGRFVVWLRPRQAMDGRIHRFKRVDGRWQKSNIADADDSVLALWIQAILLNGAGKPFDEETQRSLNLAESYLERLFDPKRGIFRVFLNDATGLYMDNVEILAASREIARLYSERGEVAASARWSSRIEALDRGIARTFPGTDGLSPAVSTQLAHRQTGSFYPDRVAAVFAWLHDYPQAKNQDRFAAWLAHNANAWRENSRNDYPWGLIALEASRAGAEVVARSWLVDSAPLRHGPRWNVLEEAVTQVLAFRLGSVAEK